MMLELARLKPFLVTELRVFLEKTAVEDSLVSPWIADLVPRLLDYATRGKMIRGALVSVGARLFDQGPDGMAAELQSVCLQVGAAMELIQSLLLIHDDIMDQDEIRRGRPSVHAQYVQLARSRQAANAQRLGESLGICAGDVSGFLAFEILASLNLPPAILVQLLALTSHELTLVGLAQMGDVHNGGIDVEVGLAEIIQLYRFKTGRYTFSLPLMAGAICSGASANNLPVLGEIGELFGIIFQIKDDDLGLFGSTDRTGKPVGSDIRDNKKTLHRHFLFERADPIELREFRAIFGQRSATDAEVQRILHRMEALGVREHIDAELDVYAERARGLIGQLEGASAYGKAALESLLSYNLSRDI